MDVLQASESVSERIQITGVAQGVGLRPAIYRLAKELRICGEVSNNPAGVQVTAWASAKELETFVEQLRHSLPLLTRNIDIRRMPHSGDKPDDFRIAPSVKGPSIAEIPPDAASCPDCMRDVFDSSNRRFLYPFTTCTQCGPRYSISYQPSFDRENTTMAEFEMCPSCREEYMDPNNRRFHAQTNCCPDCGPQLSLCDSQGNVIATENPILDTASLIKAGGIVAIKGIGGFHLACDATNEKAIGQLRVRKQRPDKPFALMASDIADVAKYAYLDVHEQTLLKSLAAPIVLLRGLPNKLPGNIAPALHDLGFVLPYSPLHHLLMSYLDNPIVFTSGNGTGLPQCIDDKVALEQLSGIADHFLLHNRRIVHRQDDSVVRVIKGNKQTLRRARGYVPLSNSLPSGFEHAPHVIAMGGDLKNSFCTLENGRAILSTSNGDLNTLECFNIYKQEIESLIRKQRPIVAVDQHEQYRSTRLAKLLVDSNQFKIEPIQHHHAHIAACMAERRLPINNKAVLGITLDGLGMGSNGSIWGGEFLIADYTRFERVASFQAIPLPGGDQATKEPWRNAFAHLETCIGWNTIESRFSDLNIVEYLRQKDVANLQVMFSKDINCPKASSAGRLFDAVAAVLGICRDKISYEGQAAMELETLATTAKNIEKKRYAIKLGKTETRIEQQWKEMWLELLEDLSNNISLEVVARRFYQSLAYGIFSVINELEKEYNFDTVVLSGGCFQSRLLLESLLEYLDVSDLKVLFPGKYPANDGGLSLGQAVIAAAKSCRPAIA